MSREIPDWLQHLKRDRRGLPVPYINLWGEEAEDRTHVRYDSNVGMLAAFLDDADEVVPDFTRQNMGRQRECMAAGLCQVCGRNVPWSRRTLVVADLSVEWIDLHGRPHMALIEPWLCERCARFAVDVCPALIRRTRAEHLRPAGYDLWQVDLSEQTGFEVLYDDRNGTAKEARVYERVFKRNLWWVGTRAVGRG